MTDRRGGDGDEIPVRAAAFAAPGFAALGLIAAAVWHESRVERVGPSSPSLPRGLARKRCGTRRLGWHAWTPRLAQPRAPRGRLLPSRSRVRPTATITVTVLSPSPPPTCPSLSVTSVTVSVTASVTYATFSVTSNTLSVTSAAAKSPLLPYCCRL